MTVPRLWTFVLLASTAAAQDGDALIALELENPDLAWAATGGRIVLSRRFPLESR